MPGLEPFVEDELRWIRRALEGWELLTRLSPRPLATRPWRVHHLPGAVNATIG